MHHSLTAYFLGGTAAMLMGLAKTGLPGVSIPAILLMVEAFPDDAKASVGAIMPAIVLGDAFAVACFHRHADWSRLWGLVPYVAAGMALGAWVLAGTTGNGASPDPGLAGGRVLGRQGLPVRFSAGRRCRAGGGLPPPWAWWPASGVTQTSEVDPVLCTRERAVSVKG